MKITLTSVQKEWCERHVLCGDFVSIEDAALRLIDERIAERDSDDLVWAEPLVNEALYQAEQGRLISLQDHKYRTEARFSAMKT
jgi:antitoxin ParD1/3/4